jgi:hypothetical protein
MTETQGWILIGLLAWRVFFSGKTLVLVELSAIKDTLRKIEDVLLDVRSSAEGMASNLSCIESDTLKLRRKAERDPVAEVFQRMGG